MAYTTIDNPKLFFNTVNYTGTGSSHAITGVGFAPNMIWIKSTSNGQKPCLFDTPRGTDEVIHPSEQTAETDLTGTGLTAFGSDGFTVAGETDINGGSMAFTSWNWKAETSSGLDFSAGDITPSAYAINTTSGIGIYKYTGDGTVGGDTIAHNLGATPKILLVKRLNATYSWAVQHGEDVATEILNLDNSNAGVSNDAFHNTYPTSTLITLGSSTYTNAAAGSSVYVCYAFAPVKGYSSIGSYIGNGNADDGTYVHLGFEPSMIICKNSASGGPAAYGWTMIGNTFGMGGSTSANPSFNELTLSLFADQLTVAATGNSVDFLSNGFKLKNAATGSNQNTAKFVYMAFAQNPFVNSSGVPNNAR